MKHFIITRNTYPAGYASAEARRELTKTYTIPSLKAQTNKEFVWLLAGSNGLTSGDLDGIPHLVFDVPVANNFEDSIYFAQRIVKEAALDLDAGEKVITTRFDNDDMLIPTFVAEIQSAAETTKFGVIDMGGYRLDLRDGRAYRDVAYRKIPSPFISLVERKAGKKCRLATAYYDQHSIMQHHFPVTRVERPGWVQLIHESNKVMARPSAEIAIRGELLDMTAEQFLAQFEFLSV
jgi:hypothetical protein